MPKNVIIIQFCVYSLSFVYTGGVFHIFREDSERLIRVNGPTAKCLHATQRQTHTRSFPTFAYVCCMRQHRSTSTYILLHLPVSRNFVCVYPCTYVSACASKWCLPTWHLCKFYTIFLCFSIFFNIIFIFFFIFFCCLYMRSLPSSLRNLTVFGENLLYVSFNVSLNVVLKIEYVERNNRKSYTFVK